MDYCLAVGGIWLILMILFGVPVWALCRSAALADKWTAERAEREASKNIE